MPQRPGAVNLQLRTAKNCQGFYAVEAPGFAARREKLDFGYAEDVPWLYGG
jgi:hypothetical protein